MPKRTTSDDSGNKQKRRKTYKKSRSILSLPRPRIIDGSKPPSGEAVRLRYVEELNIQPAASGTTYNVYNYAANGCYDPNITGTGHQPAGFDQWMAWYSHYTVKSSKIKITEAQPTATTSATGVFGVDCFPAVGTCAALMGASSGGFYAGLLENGCKFKQYGNHGNSMETAQVVKKSYSQKKFFGSADYNISRFIGDASNNPSDLAYFTFFCSSISGNTVNACTFIVEIEYIVNFSEPRFVGQS